MKERLDFFDEIKPYGGERSYVARVEPVRNHPVPSVVDDVRFLTGYLRSGPIESRNAMSEELVRRAWARVCHRLGVEAPAEFDPTTDPFA